MEEKLVDLYKKCISELNGIGLNLANIGEIDIKIAKRSSKRYGCCKQEEPDKEYYHYAKRSYRRIKVYDRFKKHHIEVSKWVMDLNDDIIKNTIMHEIIHCFPNCNNHGVEFKKYAKLINEKLGYSITRVGNKKDDCEKSNITYLDNVKYNYEIICSGCGQKFYRQKLRKNFEKRYRCGKCGGKLEVKK